MFFWFGNVWQYSKQKKQQLFAVSRGFGVLLIPSVLWMLVAKTCSVLIACYQFLVLSGYVLLIP